MNPNRLVAVGRQPSSAKSMTSALARRAVLVDELEAANQQHHRQHATQHGLVV
jgi:hypothetical protein